MPSSSFRKGERFGRLIAMSPLGMYTACLCDCGAKRTVRNDRLRSGKTQSCGCLRREMNAAAKKPPKPPTPKRPRRTADEARLVAVYWAMVGRCTNPSNADFKFYGARGIDVCQRWLGSPAQFIQDMMPTYKKGLWLERIDNDLGYSPENCEFRTPFKQSCNRRNSLTFPNGAMFPTWCRHHKLPYQKAYIQFARLRALLGRTPTQSEVLEALG